MRAPGDSQGHHVEIQNPGQVDEEEPHPRVGSISCKTTMGWGVSRTPELAADRRDQPGIDESDAERMDAVDEEEHLPSGSKVPRGAS